MRALLWARPRAESLPRGPVVSKGVCAGGTFPGLPPGASVSQSDVNTLSLLLAPRGTKAHVGRQSLSSTASLSASKTHAVTPLPSRPLSASQWEMCELGWETRIRSLHALLAADSRSSPARGAVLGNGALPPSSCRAEERGKLRGATPSPGRGKLLAGERAWNEPRLRLWAEPRAGEAGKSAETFYAPRLSHPSV